MSGKDIDLKLLHIQYCTAVKNGDMEEVLRIGELYFSALHDGALTQEDREQIQEEVLKCAVRSKNV